MDFLVYWLPSTVENAAANVRQYFAGSRKFGPAGVAAGDVLWAVTSPAPRRLTLVARIKVERVISGREGRATLGAAAWRTANQFAVGKKAQSRPKQNIDVSKFARKLAFSSGRPLPANFSGRNLQAIRKLAPEGAVLLRRAWSKTKSDSRVVRRQRLVRTIYKVTDPDAVRAAVAECESLGREAFLERYGFGKARRFFLKIGRRRYDSKAIVAVAFRHQYKGAPALENGFGGGERKVGTVLARMGFEVEGMSRLPRTRPTLDAESLERQAAIVERDLKRGPRRPPDGNTAPKRSSRNANVYRRDPAVVGWVRWEARGKCELCRQSPFLTAAGRRYLEVHHLRRLVDGGPDVTSNAVALCANCHRELHHGKTMQSLVSRLYRTIERLQRH